MIWCFLFSFMILLSSCDWEFDKVGVFLIMFKFMVLIFVILFIIKLVLCWFWVKIIMCWCLDVFVIIRLRCVFKLMIGKIVFCKFIMFCR